MLGSQLVSALASLEVEVSTVGRSANTDIQLDLDSGFLSAIPGGLRSDVIFHCAGSFADDTWSGVRANFQTNAAGCLWVLELAERLKCTSLIYAGSAFSMDKSQPGNYTSYGFTKALAENILDWGIKRLNGRFCSLRFSQLYDTMGSCVQHQPWFGRIIAYAARGLDINLPKSDSVRNFLHLNDAVQMLIAAAESSAIGILDIVHPQSYTYHQIAETAYSLFGKGGRVIIDPQKTPFRPMVFPDGSHAFNLLGQAPAISIEDGMTRIRDQRTWPAFGPLDVT